ncbi:MAG: hypothetical protein ACK514_02955 [Bacteroidota bacterium]|jgi:hypothetical protein|nr:hypothetical protein [Cytophagales bacterium]MCE2956731.1 hypothetical protein [Flammeovirgaceae bacterium]MCZ8069649.1 hypothetical protein [Cytophagales bacterium]
MATLLKMLWPWGTHTTHTAAVHDTTQYQVQTRDHTYRGVIVTQDDLTMSLRTDGGKAVKIFKNNIEKISIYESH